MNSRHNMWAVADQGVVSLGNFLTTVLLARVLAPADYGVFAMLFGAMFLLNSLHAALVLYPLLLEAAVEGSSDLPTTISGGFIVTLLFDVLAASFLAFSCFKLQRWDLMAIVIPALVLWQLQETCRRGLIAQSRFIYAFWGDAVSYIGQFAGVWVLWRINRLSLVNIFAIVSLTSLAALVIQARQTGVVTPSLGIARRAVERSLRLGKWALLSHFAAMGPTIQMYVWLLGIFFASRDAAVMQALGNILGITNPVVVAMSGLIVPAAARAAVHGGHLGAWKCAKKYGLVFAMLVLPYSLLLLFLPRLALAFLYGRTSHYLDSAALLRWLVLCYALTYVAQVRGDFLRAIERMQADFVANMAAAIVAIGSFIIGTRHYGPLPAAVFSLVLAAICRASILSWWTVRITGIAKKEETAIAATV
jgi:O-antigen/teichoic acid export membrane protein